MNVVYRPAASEISAVAAAARTAAVRIARVETFDNFKSAQPAWLQLEASNALMTPYQRYRWVSLWHHHVSSRQGGLPLIVVARDDRDAPLFVLPLERQRRAGLTIASFFGGTHANLNSAIWRRDIAAAVTAGDLRAVLSLVADRHHIDVYRFIVQPSRLGAFDNPLALLPHQRGPDDVYVAKFEGHAGPQALKACSSGSMRKRLRAKERKLQELPQFRALEATTPAEVERILAAFLQQKAAHLADQGIRNAFEDKSILEFLRAACNDGLAAGAPVIELRALEAEGDIIAVFGGINDGRRTSCMFISYTTGPARQWSPGLILLAKMIAHYADRGIGSLDLGAGYAPYKALYCQDTERVFDTIIGLTPRGRIAAYGLRRFRHLKGWMKSQASVWRVMNAIRRRLG